MNANKSKNGRSYKPQDFIPDYLGERDPLPKSEDELWERINSSMTALGGVR